MGVGYLLHGQSNENVRDRSAPASHRGTSGRDCRDFSTATVACPKNKMDRDIRGESYIFGTLSSEDFMFEGLPPCGGFLSACNCCTARQLCVSTIYKYAHSQ